MRQTASTSSFLHGRNLRWSDVLPGKKGKCENRMANSILRESCADELLGTINAKGHTIVSAATALSIDVDRLLKCFSGRDGASIESIKCMTAAVRQLAAVDRPERRVSEQMVRVKLARANATGASDIKKKVPKKEIVVKKQRPLSETPDYKACASVRVSQAVSLQNLDKIVILAEEKGYHACEINTMLAVNGMSEMRSNRSQAYWDRVTALFTELPTRAQFVIDHPMLLPCRA